MRMREVILKKINHLISRFNLLQVTHNNKTWSDVCFKVPIVSQPKCFDASYQKYLTLFGRKKRSIEDDDDWFDDDDDGDWFSEGEESMNDTDECENFNLPKFSISQLASLQPLMNKYKTEGFSLDVGMSHYFYYFM